MNPAGHKPKPNNFIEQRADFREVIANVSECPQNFCSVELHEKCHTKDHICM